MWPNICRYFKPDNRSADSSSLFCLARDIHISRIFDRLRKSYHLLAGKCLITWCSSWFEKSHSQRRNGNSLLKWKPRRRDWVFRISLSSLQPTIQNRPLHSENDVLNRVFAIIDCLSEQFPRSLSIRDIKGRDSNILLWGFHHHPLHNIPTYCLNFK